MTVLDASRGGRHGAHGEVVIKRGVWPEKITVRLRKASPYLALFSFANGKLNLSAHSERIYYDERAMHSFDKKKNSVYEITKHSREADDKTREWEWTITLTGKFCGDATKSLKFGWITDFR